MSLSQLFLVLVVVLNHLPVNPFYLETTLYPEDSKNTKSSQDQQYPIDSHPIDEDVVVYSLGDDTVIVPGYLIFPHSREEENGLDSSKDLDTTSLPDVEEECSTKQLVDENPVFIDVLLLNDGHASYIVTTANNVSNIYYIEANSTFQNNIDILIQSANNSESKLVCAYISNYTVSDHLTIIQDIEITAANNFLNELKRLISLEYNGSNVEIPYFEVALVAHDYEIVNARKESYCKNLVGTLPTYPCHDGDLVKFIALFNIAFVSIFVYGMYLYEMRDFEKNKVRAITIM